MCLSWLSQLLEEHTRGMEFSVLSHFLYIGIAEHMKGGMFLSGSLGPVLADQHILCGQAGLHSAKKQSAFPQQARSIFPLHTHIVAFCNSSYD